jgi:hypothetical protein
MWQQLKLRKPAVLSFAGLKVTDAVVDVELAEHLLSFNDPKLNRELDPKRLEKYKRAARNNRWFSSAPEGIAFAWIDGKIVLINGQHRLKMVVETSIPQAMVIFLDCNPEAYTFLDQKGTEKSLNQRLKSMGRNKAKTGYAPAVKMAAEGCLGTVFSGSDFEVIDLIDFHNDALDSFMPIITARKTSKTESAGLGCAGVNGALLLFSYVAPANKVKEAANFIRYGSLSDSKLNTQPLYALKSYMLDIKVAGSTWGGATRGIIFKRACYALSAFVNNENITSIEHASDEHIIRPPKEVLDFHLSLLK